MGENWNPSHVVTQRILPPTAEDEEETIDAEEKLEGDVDHSKELDDLTTEGSEADCAQGREREMMTNRGLDFALPGP